MLARLPSKNKRNVYVLIKPSGKNKTASGDEDIQVPKLESQITSDKVIEKNESLKQLTLTLQNKLEILTQEILEKNEKITTLQNIQRETKKSIVMDEDIAKLREELSKEKRQLQENDQLKRMCEEKVGKLQEQLQKFYEENAFGDNLIQNKDDSLDLIIKNVRNALEKYKNEFEKCTIDKSESSRRIEKLENEIQNLREEKVKYLSEEGSAKNVLREQLELAKQSLVEMKTFYENEIHKNTESRNSELSMLKNEVEKAMNELSVAKQNCVQAKSSDDETKINLQTNLSNALNDVNAAKNEYNAFKRTSEETRLKEIETANNLLSTAESEFREYKQLCAQEMSLLNKECSDKQKVLQEENTNLQKQLKELQFIVENAQKQESKVSEEVFQVCKNNKTEILAITPFIKRQVQVFEELVKLNKNNDSVVRFVNANGDYFEKAKVLLTSVQTLDILDCKETSILHENARNVSSKMKELSALTNLYEDVSGAVRVYVRIKPMNNKENVNINSKKNLESVEKTGQSVIFKGCYPGDNSRTFGRFFGVFPKTFKNVDIYSGCSGTKSNVENLKIISHEEENNSNSLCCVSGDTSGLCRVINQLSDGYHVMMFGYGYSGSGKTHTLLGNTEETGIAQLAVANSGAKSVYLKTVFELTFDKIDFRSKNFNAGKFIELFRRDEGVNILRKVPETMVKSEENELAKFLKNPLVFKNKPITPMELQDLKDNLDIYRMHKGRVKSTPNNPKSSRSHLFIVLQFEFANGNIGYLTIIDMGGRESTLDILEMFLEKPEEKNWQISSLLMNDPMLYPRYLTPHKFTTDDSILSWVNDSGHLSTKDFKLYVERLNLMANNLETVIELLKESVFINETINQLITFFKELRGLPSGIGTNKLPTDEKRNPYDPRKFLTGKPTRDEKMGMYTALNLLSNLDSKKAKYVMLCHVRQETNPSLFCKSTLETLEFAHEIRST